MLTRQSFGQTQMPPASNLAADSSCLRVYAKRPVRDLLTLAALTRPLFDAINAKEGRHGDPMIAEVAAFLNRHASTDRTAPASSLDPIEGEHLCQLVSNAYVRGEAYIRAGQGTPAMRLAWTQLDTALREMEPVIVGRKPTAPGLTFTTMFLAAGALAAFAGVMYIVVLGGPRPKRRR